MAGNRVTAEQVARHAGVSQSAVSRVFTPGGSASPNTVQRVQAAAAELGYRPNVLARSLKAGRSRMIGIVVAYLDNPFYPDALEKFSKTLQARGYHALVFMAGNEAENMESVMSEILDYQVDGLVLASAGMSTELTERCKQAGVPVLLFNRGQGNPIFSEVTSDNYSGGYTLGEFLVKGGHTRIAHIAGWAGASTQQDRERGFCDALAAHGQSLFARAEGLFHADTARAAAKTLFAAPIRPDAVFVANDHMALAVMDVLRFELGLRVPEDVSVVGYDDVPQAAWDSYLLTTVRQRSAKMVECAVDTLLEQIDHPDTLPSQHALEAPLKVRSSARIPEGYPNT